MTAEPEPAPDAPPSPRRRWVGRVVVALVMVGLPATAAAGLGWLWARSLRFAEVATLAHDGGAVDPASGAATTHR